ncbi:Cyclic di-GMP phosphodiesterase response regulator RpfG [subsurface metagenome]
MVGTRALAEAERDPSSRSAISPKNSPLLCTAKTISFPSSNFLVIAKKMGIEEEDLFIIEIGALLHDVGKIGVPDAILHKPGPLVVEEYQQIQEHPQKGKKILNNITYLAQAIPCVLHHHERFDGKGYPEKISGTDIPLPGRIISVADAFDAMTSDRPYRIRMSIEQAIGELNKNSGKQFDPKVVDAFVKIWKSGDLLQLMTSKEG